MEAQPYAQRLYLERLSEAFKSNKCVRSNLRQFKHYVNSTTWQAISNQLAHLDNNRFKSYARQATAFYLTFYKEINEAMEEYYKIRVGSLL